MKKLFCFLFTLLLLITLQAPAFAQDQSEVSTEKIDTSAWVTYKIKELGMSIKLPPDMKVYTRESIKKGNVEEDERLANSIDKLFTFPSTSLVAIGITNKFVISITNYFDIPTFLLPNLFFSDDITFDNYVSQINEIENGDTYVKFTSSYGNFLLTTGLGTSNDYYRTIPQYQTTANYRSIIINFLTISEDITLKTQYFYNEIVRSIQFSTYIFNLICFIVFAIIFTIFFIMFRFLIKKR